MRRPERESRRAATQFAGLALICVLLGGVAAWQVQRPADATTLALPISELRSQSAELAILQHERNSGGLDARFLRNHTRQLAKLNDESRDELAGLAPWPELAETQRAALDDARTLERQLATVASGANVEERDLEALRDRFRARERALRN